ncbi:MAG: type II toxin-antitoxin system RelE/ParE family toxin [Methylococcaceae bacterium]|nr:type II toxin-antitoxin system RelE/ParE family toxin [Methylococcaceae bacterium]
MKIKILPSALQDLEDGYDFYQQQSTGLGSYFLDSLYSDIDSLQITAGYHSIHLNHYHRLLSKRFPFAVYYKVKSSHAVIYAVLDCRRKPSWIKQKLRQL